MYFVGTWNAMSYLFVYSIGAPAASAIYAAPPLANFAPTAGSFLVSCSSSSFKFTDFVVLVGTSNSQVYAYTVPQNPQIVVTSLYNSPNNQPVQTFPVLLNASSVYLAANGPPAAIPFSINILNSQEVITPNPQSNAAPVPLNLASNTSTHTAYFNPSNYFNGTIFNIQITDNNTNVFSVVNKTTLLSGNNPLNGLQTFSAA